MAFEWSYSGQIFVSIEAGLQEMSLACDLSLE